MGGYREEDKVKVSAMPKIGIFGLVLLPFLLMLGSCVFIFKVAQG